MRKVKMMAVSVEYVDNGVKARIDVKTTDGKVCFLARVFPITDLRHVAIGPEQYIKQILSEECGKIEANLGELFRDPAWLLEEVTGRLVGFGAEQLLSEKGPR